MTDVASSQSLQLLVITAHPHDVTWMLGTCGNHVERGDQVAVVCVTGGAGTHNEALADELRKPAEEREPSVLEEASTGYLSQKRAELTEACALFGITDVRVLPFTDKPIVVTDEIRRALADVVYETRPDIVLTESPYRMPERGRLSMAEDDHLTVGKLVGEVLGTVGLPDVEKQRAPHRVAAVYSYAMLTHASDVDVLIDISDQAEKRMKAEILFESQGHTEAWSRKRMESSIGSYGWAARVGYAEPFIRWHTRLQRHLSVSDEELRAARVSREEHHRICSQLIP